MPKQKSYKQWAQHLPKHIRQLFIANVEETKSVTNSMKQSTSLSDMIDMGFVWVETPQSWHFWYTLKDACESQEGDLTFAGKYSWKNVKLSEVPQLEIEETAPEELPAEEYAEVIPVTGDDLVA